MLEILIIVLMIIIITLIINKNNNTKNEKIESLNLKKTINDSEKECIQYNGHSLINGKCTICGCSESAIKNFGWECGKISSGNFDYNRNSKSNQSKKTYYDIKDHKIANGRCTICGLNVSEIEGCGWKCRSEKTKHSDNENSNKSENINSENLYELERNYIDLFEFDAQTNKETLRKKYLELIKQYHPDRVTHLGKEFNKIAEEKTKQINDAYEILMRKLN